VQNGGMPRKKEERLYVGCFEIYRAYNGIGADVSLERETLHIMDDKRRIALIETRTAGVDGAAEQLVRYQLGNHLGSSILELDAQGDIISYEEYYPYGGTSSQAVRSDLEASPKRYRYTGKERDDESGLYYYGARYYVPWLGRWASCDPAGLVDGANLYMFVHGSPVNCFDPTGHVTFWTMLSSAIEMNPARRTLRAAEQAIRGVRDWALDVGVRIAGNTIGALSPSTDRQTTENVLHGLSGAYRAAHDVAGSVVASALTAATDPVGTLVEAIGERASRAYQRGVQAHQRLRRAGADEATATVGQVVETIGDIGPVGDTRDVIERTVTRFALGAEATSTGDIYTAVSNFGMAAAEIVPYVLPFVAEAIGPRASSPSGSGTGGGTGGAPPSSGDPIGAGGGTTGSGTFSGMFRFLEHKAQKIQQHTFLHPEWLRRIETKEVSVLSREYADLPFRRAPDVSRIGLFNEVSAEISAGRATKLGTGGGFSVTVTTPDIAGWVRGSPGKATFRLEVQFSRGGWHYFPVL
jgi:RHS repeat-associated protein